MKTSRLVLAATALLGFIVSPVLAAEPGTWTLKGGVGTVAPKGSNLTFSDEIDTITIHVDDGTSFTLSATYMFTENWGFEVLAAAPFEHDIKASVEGSVGKAKIGSTKHLPPTFSAIYHFAPDATFQPYIGVGVNWTLFSSTKLVPELAADGLIDLDLDDSVGVATVIAGDWMLSDKLLLSIEARWINIESDAKLIIDGGDDLPIGTVEIDPWVYAIYLGYRF